MPSLKQDRSLGFAFGVPTATSFSVTFSGVANGVAVDEDATYRLETTQDCYFCFALSGVDSADSDCAILQAGDVEYFHVHKTSTAHPDYQPLQQVSALEVNSGVGGTLKLVKMAFCAPFGRDY